MYHIEAGKGTLSLKAYGLISRNEETEDNEAKKPAAGGVGRIYFAFTRFFDDCRCPGNGSISRRIY